MQSCNEIYQQESFEMCLKGDKRPTAGLKHQLNSILQIPKKNFLALEHLWTFGD